jgi:amino-acid N-acetyltransferase
VAENDYAQWFRDSTPYISKHQNRTFVVFLDGEALALDSNRSGSLTNIVHDLALVHVLGARLVMVHGARPQLDEALTSAGPDSFHNGRRITREDDLPTVLRVFGELRARLEALFSTGLPTSPLRDVDISVISGNFITARPVGILDGVDHELTGRVRRVHAERLTRVLDSGAIVLLSPIGYSPSGQVFNLAADELAADVALSLNADKLIVFTEADGLTGPSGERISQMTPAELHNQVAAGADHLASVLRAARGGVASCQLVSWAADGALLQELYTAAGSGTQIQEDAGAFIRPAGAADVAHIVEVIRPLEESGALVRRNRDRLEEEIAHFLVADIDRSVVGCCAVYPFGEMAELACVAVHASYRDGPDSVAAGNVGAGERSARVGSSLLAAAEERARQSGASALFALTTQTHDWFLDQGFEEAGLDSLPAPKQAMYNYQRNATVMIKALDT